MLQADPSKVSSRAKKRGLPQVSRHRVSLRQYCTSLIALGVCPSGMVIVCQKVFLFFFPIYSSLLPFLCSDVVNVLL